ncbi:MAG: Spy/CpxP family protein refolding chaperone [Gemmatimonadales bacterium]
MFNKSKAWAFGLLVAVFAAGMATGAAVDALADDEAPRRGRRSAEAMVAHLTRELDLSPVQRDSLRAIMERHRPAFEAAWREMRPRYDSLRQRVRGEIAAQLTPEQRARYERLMADLEHQHRRSDSEKDS